MGNKFCICVFDPSQSAQFEQSPLKSHLMQMNLSFIDPYVVAVPVPQISHRMKDYHEMVLHKILGIQDGSLSMHVLPAKRSQTGRIKPNEYIKKDLDQQSRNVFQGIVTSYFRFLCELFDLQAPQLNPVLDDKTKQDSISPSNEEFKNSSWESHYNRMMTHNASLINWEDARNKSSMFTSIHERNNQRELVAKHLDHLFRSFTAPQQAAALMLQQFDFILRLLRYYINTVYRSVLDFCIGTDADMVPAREVCTQRLVEHFILTKYSPACHLVSYLAERHYKDLEELLDPGSLTPGKGSMYAQSQDLNRTEPVLDKTLHPKSQPDEFCLDLGSMEDSSLYREEITQPAFVCREKSEHKAQFLALIARSEKAIHQTQAPYSQTFPLILRIVRVRKFWKKFKLIKSLDRQIVSIFMRKRTESQYNRCFDTISAEDSKSEILFYVLYSFQKAYPSINLHKDLYVTLRLMNDFDGCLHQDLKYVFCPDFLRFFNILEMLIHSEVCS